MKLRPSPPLRRRPLLARSAVLAAAAFLTATCGGGNKNTGGDAGAAVAMSRRALLGAAGACALSTYREFLTSANALAAATAALADAPAATAPLRTSAQQAWREAAAAWQRAELFQFGPAAVKTEAGGQDLRDQIYSWPQVSRCFIEQEIVGKGYEAAGFANQLVHVRGLFALEYLLFYVGNDNACAASAAINAGGGWAQLTADELDRRKRSYAKVVAADVVVRAQALITAWEPTGGNFGAALSGDSAGPYASPQAALNAVADAALYLEKPVKDIKLGRPLGFEMEGTCTKPPCLDTLESRFAAATKTYVENNLVGARRLLLGCTGAGEGVGFDDLLEAMGATDLAARMRTGFADSFAALAAIEEPTLAAALTADLPSVVSAYNAFKTLTTLLKTEMYTVLDLQRPESIGTDND